LKIKIIISTILSLYSLSFLVYGSSAANFTVYAQSYLQTIKQRNLVMDLGNGVKTNAQLTYPAIVGNGKYPGVLLITGSGAEDMNETGGFIRIDKNRRKDISANTIFPNSQISIGERICSTSI
jgi:uncharacterized protein